VQQSTLLKGRLRLGTCHLRWQLRQRAEKRKIITRIEGHEHGVKRMRKCAIRIAQGLNPSIRSIVHPRKRNKPPITSSSGPHVHKKSRDQFRTTCHSIASMIVPRGNDDRFKSPKSRSVPPGANHAYPKREQVRPPTTPNKDEQGKIYALRAARGRLWRQRA
jgi:hypothetical protein